MVRRRVDLLVMMAIAAALGAAPAAAFPIAPVPLWELVWRSDLVVLADVIEVSLDEQPEPDITDWAAVGTYLDQDAVARLRVRETWKGEPLESVDVSFPRFLICPAPPRYVEGRVVIAFLAKIEGRWATTALSYGTLYPGRDEVNDFRSLVGEAVDLQKLSPVSRGNRLDWHVKAASRPATRWHGLYALAPEGDELRSFYGWDGEGAAPAAGLPADQIRRIAGGSKEAPSTDRTLPMILAVLSGHRDEEVDRTAASAIEALLEGPRVPWWIKRALRETLSRFGDPDPVKRLAPLGDTFSSVDPDLVRSLWEEARRELRIPAVPPARMHDDDEEVGGVGENTPD